MGEKGKREEGGKGRKWEIGVKQRETNLILFPWLI